MDDGYGGVPVGGGMGGCLCNLPDWLSDVRGGNYGCNNCDCIVDRGLLYLGDPQKIQTGEGRKVLQLRLPGLPFQMP